MSTTTDTACGRTYRARAQHCTSCHETFTGTNSGDQHRTGTHGIDRRCRTIAEMLTIGMQQTQARRMGVQQRRRSTRPFHGLAGTDPHRDPRMNLFAATGRSLSQSAGFLGRRPQPDTLALSNFSLSRADRTQS